MNTIDRIIRVLIGLVCVWAGFLAPDVIANDILSFVVGLFGVLNIGSAIVAHCPVYLIAGLSSLKNSSDDANG